MDSMEIDDDIYINKNLTMQGLIAQGTVSTWKHMDGNIKNVSYNDGWMGGAPSIGLWLQKIVVTVKCK